LEGAITERGRPIDPEELAGLMARPGNLPPEPERLTLEDVADHLRDRLCPDNLFEVLDWHVKEVDHVNVRRHQVLRWPVLGPMIRDQHEINRLILIAIEKGLELALSIESELGRLFGHFRQSDRSYWVRQFRYLGGRWTEARESVKELRSDWELGRHPLHRLWARAGQDRMNPMIEKGLASLAEGLSVLVTIINSEALIEQVGNLVPADRIHLPELDLAATVESAIWHAREGNAVRGQDRNRVRAWRFLTDEQRRLNRLYHISLEGQGAILKALSQRIGLLGALLESAVHRPPS
jgi:hypothetical protein